MSCIGTAGHVDHGKSTLVLALTGMDPDRLAEEKARGMTIDLGFAWLTLPSGREAGIVDVPGHESFIRNMLAGVGGIDVALLVVAADEGVMPQTDEHLAILDLLRVRSGVVALTKRDLVDDEWLELVREEVRERLAGTTLAGAPIIPCSATTRAGLDDLVAALDAALAVEPDRAPVGGARLPVDRVFSMTGFGTVVTGTLLDGPLRLGQEVELLPRRLRARVRGLQSHKHAVELAQPGNRVAVNLAGVTTHDVRRGDVLAGQVPLARVAVTSAFDAQITVLGAAPRPLTQQAEVSVYSGAAEVMARVTLLDGDTIEPGATGWAQFRLRAPLVLARGDRFIARIPSPSLTIGGGAVIEPVARRHRRHDAAVLARLALLARADPREVVLAALESEARPAGASAPRRSGGYGGQTTSEIARRTGYQDADAAAVLAELEAAGAVVRVADWRFSAGQWQRLRAQSAHLLAEYHAQHPLRAGMPREEWRARLGCGLPLATEIVRALRTAGELREAPTASATTATTATTATADALLAAPDFAPAFTPAQQAAAARALALFHASPYTPPTRAEVEELAGRDVTAALIERGDLV
ncbi:MAG TPA: selenocysteine-specific translation elongation factor, partial [Ktedonobacterales bacterium]|nr:selenocysteine-specific translation elongation factor [Ktedonobacterales bacterium]